MAKSFDQLMNEVEFPTKFNKFVANTIHTTSTYPNDTENEENFKEKGPKTPNRPKGHGAPGGKKLAEGSADVVSSYSDEIYRLMEEIDSIYDQAVFAGSTESIKKLAEKLRDARDTILEQLPINDVDSQKMESTGGETVAPATAEQYEAGDYDLADGTTITVSEDVAEALNSLFVNKRAQQLLEKTMFKNHKEFNAVVQMAEMKCQKCAKCDNMPSKCKCTKMNEQECKCGKMDVSKCKCQNEDEIE